MKKNLRAFLSYLLPVAVIGILSTGCKTTDIYLDSASIAVVQTGDFTPTEFSATLTPSASTTKYEYALGTPGDRAAFEAGTLSSIVKQTGNQKLTVKFDKLTVGKTYTLYARAYKDEIAGTVTVMVPLMNEDGYEIKTTFLSDCAAGLSIAYTTDFYKIEYGLGLASDRTAFDNGTLDTYTIAEEQNYRGATYFELEPSTEYVFFFRTTDRNGTTGKIVETPIQTLAAGTGPSATMTVDKINIFRGEYSFTANSEAGAIAILVCNKGHWDDVINNEMNFRGDAFQMFSNWFKTAAMMYTAVGEGKVPVIFDTPDLKLESPLEAYVLVTNKAQQPVSLLHFDFFTPAENKNAPKATATLTLGEITAGGATFTMEGGSTTFAYMYDIVEADWYDEFKTTTDWAPNYLGNTLFANGYFWHYGNQQYTHTEEYGQAEMRYYAAIVPMNENGPFSGWGDEVLVEFTTLAAPAPEPTK